MNDGHILEQFLEMMMVERGVAAYTIDAYRKDLSDYQQFLHEQGSNVTDVDARLLMLWHEDAKLRGHQSSSIARKFSAIRQLHKFMLIEQWRDDNPTKLLKMPKLGRKLPKTISDKEMQNLFDVLDNMQKHQPHDAIRLTCLLEILYGSGLRVSELVSLPLSAILSDAKLLRVMGKGNKERIVPLSDLALQALQAWLSIRGHYLPKNNDQEDKGFLFPSKSKQGHLTRQRFGQMLKELAVLANIPPTKISPHVVRHAFASHLLNNGAGLLSVQKMLGHADITTTQIYTHILSDELKKFVLQNHPLNKM
ncbi:MAG: site-specific tyrosine recombinase XerD [Alphaproteobacteria bacterium]|nr:site-specific tyrosine recombinase XerD [Alphaproteobacteria bacterium]